MPSCTRHSIVLSCVTRTYFAAKSSVRGEEFHVGGIGVANKGPEVASDSGALRGNGSSVSRPRRNADHAGEGTDGTRRGVVRSLPATAQRVSLVPAEAIFGQGRMTATREKGR